MQQMSHQMMGYDRAITMFSPDGRLLQVEYAKKTVKQGSTAIGITCKDGVILVADKRIFDDLVVAESVEKVFQIDDHIASTASGIISDARVLIERAQVKAQQNNVTYNSPIDVLTVVKDMCDLMQVTTQSGGLRPFGVSVLVAGVDVDGIKLYKTDPIGIYWQYSAVAIGEGQEEVEKILKVKYKPTISLEEGFDIAIGALKEVLNKDFNPKRLDVAFIRSSDKQYVKMDNAEIEKIAKRV